MIKIIQRSLFLTVILMLAACSAEDFTRAGYSALQQHQCLEQTGISDCDLNSLSYDEYQQQRTDIPE